MNELAAVMTVVSAEHAFLCEQHYAESGPDIPHWIVAEPVPRNTAAAVAVAAAICRRRLGDNAVLLVLPADHLIADASGFWESALRAATSARAGNFSLLGIAPTRPATGYGYIQRGEQSADGLFAVRRFVEKPDRPRAESFLKSGDYFWNAGVFCFRAGTLLNALPDIAPDIARPLSQVVDGLSESEPTAESEMKTGTESQTAFRFSPDRKACESFPNISFDRAVMEKVPNATVADARNIGWSDVGSWRAMGETLPPDSRGNRVCGSALALDSDDCVIVADAPGRLVAAVGAKGLHIIDSPDALLVSPADASERAREVFEKIRGDGFAETPITVPRPWGSYTVLSEGDGHKVKRIEVSPGAKLSLQSHRRRSEHWTTVVGTMTVTVGDREFAMATNESCFIPQGARHRMANRTGEPAALIEVQVGDYLGEDDIVRYEDDYGRA